MPAMVSSAGVRGATYCFFSPARERPGAGSARRSTLPLSVRGRLSINMKVEGSM
jgi:hypothetical protein